LRTKERIKTENFVALSLVSDVVVVSDSLSDLFKVDPSTSYGGVVVVTVSVFVSW